MTVDQHPPRDAYRVPDGVLIRAETPEDAPGITAVHRAAFPRGSVDRLVELLRDTPAYVPDMSLVAIIDGRVVGHVMIGIATLRDGSRDRPIAMLSPLGVLPEAQRRGIGSALVDRVVERADRRGEPVVVLEGDPAFYGRLGFVAAEGRGIYLPLPGWARPECAQIRVLRDSVPPLRGRVIYPQPFDLVAD